ncbi:zinc finger E-box-binding homeobox 1 [Drosophila biarmipes]|uniref:zinc finger E-box-binding homeobox 1 n=1 Tax=Drosophila biarmipes TaxID=125945 RepID=UPI0007E74F3D|nr:zinc finger E-box-binding homeobox 1 [Drosophila biarmipes]
MHVDLALVKQEVDTEDARVKLEPQDDLPDAASEVLSARDTLKFLEKGSQMMTSPIRNRLGSEDERSLIASLERDQQQLLAVSAEDKATPKECNICHYLFESHLDFSGHRVNHEMNRHFCRLGCGIWLDTLEQILEHEYRQHSPIGDVFCCRVCDFLARDADSLASHMKKHVYVYRYVCAICRRHFESNQSLSLHRKYGQFSCGRVQYLQGLSSKPELVAVNTPVSAESLCDVQIKEEPLNAEEGEQMQFEDVPSISFKLEPLDDDMSDVGIKEEPVEHGDNKGTIWPTIPTPLRNKLRLPAINSAKVQVDLKTVNVNGLPNSNVASLLKTSPQAVNASNLKVTTHPNHTTTVPQKKPPIAANILKVLPSNCMVIKLPPNTKIFKMPVQTPAASKESQTAGLSDMEKLKSVIKIPQAISISKVNSAENPATISTPPTIQTVLPAQTHSRSSCFLVDAFNKSESRPESMKIITEFRNQIRSIEKTLPLPGTVLQSTKINNDIPCLPPLVGPDAPKPVELTLNPLCFIVAKELQIQYPLYRFMWTCPYCQRFFEKHCAFRMHLTSKHFLTQEQLNSLKVILMPYKILSQDSTSCDPKEPHVPLATNLESKPHVPKDSPNPDETVALPFLPNDAAVVAPLKDQTPALSNLSSNKDSATSTKSTDKSAGPKKLKKNQGQFQCTECSKVFTTFGALRIHKTIHTGELPHKCNYCDKRFRTPGQVRVHHRRHTGEKPFKCKVCSLDFTHRETLISHLSRHIGMKRYKCYGCDKYFVVVSGLRAHRRLRPDTCGKVKFTARAHGPRVRVIRGEVIFEHHPEHNGYLRSEDPLNILSQRGQAVSSPPE